MTMPQSRLTDVLLADDSQADVLLTEEAVALSGQPAQLRFANEGQDALEQLRNTPHDLPRLMLLDVTMPRMNGFEVLAHLQSRRAVAACTGGRPSPGDRRCGQPLREFTLSDLRPQPTGGRAVSTTRSGRIIELGDASRKNDQHKRRLGPLVLLKWNVVMYRSPFLLGASLCDVVPECHQRLI